MHGKPSVIVGWVTSGVIRAEFVRSLLALQATKHEHWEFGGIIDQISAYIDENRNMLVKEFLDGTKANWMLMVDIDMAFNPVVLDRLWEFAKAGERIIAGIYNQWMPSKGLIPLSFTHNPETDLYHAILLDKPTHVAGAPAGFLFIHREPLERLRTIYKNNWFTRLPAPDDRFYGEDISFCRRLREQNIPILGVPKLEIRHLKIVPI